MSAAATPRRGSAAVALFALLASGQVSAASEALDERPKAARDARRARRLSPTP